MYFPTVIWEFALPTAAGAAAPLPLPVGQDFGLRAAGQKNQKNQKKHLLSREFML
jgi:hypothetical protein